MKEERHPDEKEEEAEVDSDWENRKLCSDEGCIGVIGPDGRCKECGRIYEGALNTTERSLPDAADNEEAETDEADAAVEDKTVAEEEDATDADADLDWQKRTLCSDENCIGVIGPDGRCRECGKPYEG